MGRKNKSRLIPMEEVKISKDFTNRDWVELRRQLVLDENWETAFRVFNDRVQTRFLTPIEKIKGIEKNEGQGFSITLISVALLEHLAALESGKIYKVSRPGSRRELSPIEYSVSAGLFNSFLKKATLFKESFSDGSRKNFYDNIRCGLVHEARTLGNDIIISDTSEKNERKGELYFKIGNQFRLNRDELLRKIQEHVSQMRSRLLDKNDQLLKRNFILKFDEISGLKHDWYFIYGSNLNESQINERLLKHGNCYLGKERCQLKEYKFVYNKKSIDGTAKANLVKFEGGVVEGVAICVEKTALGEFLKEFETGYDVVEVDLWIGESSFKAVTCISHDFIEVGPSEDYVNKILIGAEENDLPEEYINEFLRPKNV